MNSFLMNPQREIALKSEAFFWQAIGCDSGCATCYANLIKLYLITDLGSTTNVADKFIESSDSSPISLYYKYDLLNSLGLVNESNSLISELSAITKEEQIKYKDPLTFQLYMFCVYREKGEIIALRTFNKEKKHVDEVSDMNSHIFLENLKAFDSTGIFKQFIIDEGNVFKYKNSNNTIVEPGATKGKLQQQIDFGVDSF
jgi:hypothetical protein